MHSITERRPKLNTGRNYGSPPLGNNVTWILRIGLLLVLFCAVWRLVDKAAADALQMPRDFRGYYLSARTWGMGLNPYDRQTVTRVAAQTMPGAAGSMSASEWHETPPVYPPTTWMLIWPFTFLSWKAATFTWLVVNVASLAILWVSLSKLAEIPATGFRAVSFGAIFLCFGPLNVCLRLGNGVLCAGMLGVVSLLWSVRSYRFLGGLLLGCATALKPQIGIVFLICLALQGRWRVCFTAAACLLALSIVSIARMEIAHVNWASDLMQGIHSTTEPGGINDFSAANKWAWQLLNIQFMLFHALPSARGAVGLLAYAITLLLVIPFAFTIWRMRGEVPELLTLSALIVLSLLPVYHRYYDAVLLAIPIVWATATISPRRWHLQFCVLLCTIPFYRSGNYVALMLADEGRLPHSIATSWFWQTFALPCESWALLILSVVLLVALARQGRRKDDEASPKRPLTIATI